VLVSFLIHRGSQQSKDSDEQLRAQLDEMEERLIRIETAIQGRAQ
jgi:hypothetical protein